MKIFKMLNIFQHKGNTSKIKCEIPFSLFRISILNKTKQGEKTHAVKGVCGEKRPLLCAL